MVSVSVVQIPIMFSRFLIILDHREWSE